MAFTSQVLVDGPRNYVIKIAGTTSDASALLVDVSTLNPPCEKVRLDQISYDIGVGCIVSLLWDATADVTAITLSEGPGQTMCFKNIGGIQNDAGAGVTGDVLLTSTVAASQSYTLVLWFVKKTPALPR